MSAVNLRGYVRGFMRAFYNEGPESPLQITTGGELLVAQALPSETELARQGAGWVTIGAAVAPVVAIPTTGAHLSLYNGYTDKSLVIAAVGSWGTTSMAAAGQASLLCRNDVPGQNAAPAVPGLIISGLSGKNYTGKAISKASVALAAIGAGNNVAWVPVGPSVSAVTTTTVGMNLHTETYGRWIVPPGGIFSLATAAQTAVGTFQPYIKFYEMLLILP